MIVRLKLAMDQSEYSALLKSAVNNLRNPVDQAHYIIRQELTRLGLLPGDPGGAKKGIEMKADPGSTIEQQ